MDSVYKEVHEARLAGERALSSLQEAKKNLSSAGKWGIADIFGGGAIVGFIKHSKIDNAKHCIERARLDLRSFQRELSDVAGYVQNIDVGDFLTFADFFFDGFVADMMVQSKISRMKKQVDEAIFRVEAILRQLRSLE